MKNLISSIFLLIVTILNAQKLPPILPPCINGNAESNSYLNWTTYIGAATNPLNANNFVVGNTTARFGIHNSTTNYSPGGILPMIVNGVDRYGNFPVPSEGTYCFSLGNNMNNSQAEMMRYTFTVNNENKNFKLRYAIVVQDGDHPAGENGGAFFYMVKGAKVIPNMPEDMGIYALTNRQYIADLSNPYWKRSAVDAQAVYKDWQCLEYDLTPYLGQQVSFVAIVRDCTNGGHWGYMYLDGLCTAWPATANATLNGSVFCAEQQIIMNGMASTGEDKYFLEVAEADATGGYLSGGVVVSDWFLGQQAPNNINVTAYFESKGYKFKCGKKYRIKLAVANECAVWNETVKQISIVCPKFSAANDVTSCCGGEGIVGDPFSIGTTTVPGHNYTWTSIPSGFTSNNANPSVNPTSNIAYVGTMTDLNGCIARDTVVFRYTPSYYTMTLTQNYPLCQFSPTVSANLVNPFCPVNPEFNAIFPTPAMTNINWYFKPAGSSTSIFLGSGIQMNAPNSDGIMTATLNSPCMGTSTVSATTTIWRRPNGNEFIYPNVITPDNGQLNNIFRILEFGEWAPQNIGEGPAYGAEDFKLRLWNRWGENFRTITKADVGRAQSDYLRQGDIAWDGYDRNPSASGTPELVQNNTTYVFTLEMKYCGSTSFVQVQIGEENPCIRWDPIFHICINRISGWAGQINVIY